MPPVVGYRGKLIRAKSPCPVQSWYILNVQVKRSARADKRFIENLATEAEAAAKHQEQGSQGKFVEFSGEQRHLFVTIKKEQEEHRSEYFQEVLNNDVRDADEEDRLDIIIDPAQKKRSWKIPLR
ncbi:hypothetical protein OS493_028486 [Desmophyllum pertusum]|uniref:Uncharacterized protein n=1 Tax=Desmophyllum pertusum TaxID=174260 RepID=A0A9X0CX13_9CNID|nr:hypothetical protein OS493_028486 [Desmophyllum pertusum]